MWLAASRSALVLIPFAVASPTQAHFQQSYSATDVVAYSISIPVDHFNASDAHTYTNRYWVNDAYYKRGSPVFFYDFGEAGATNSSAAGSLGETENTTTAPVELAKRFSGHIIGWEHRFYGDSLPFALNSSSGIFRDGVDAYRYLTIEQALEDVVYFAKHFAPPGYDTKLSQYVSPSKTPWIWIGGSYPGMRGAMLRLRNPELFYAVWASSATVQARSDLSVYYNPIYRSMPQNCSSDIHAVIQYIDGILSSDQQILVGNLKQQFFALYNSIASIDALYNISEGLGLLDYDVGHSFSDPLIVDFQDRGPSRTVHRFCDWMESYNPSLQPGLISPSDPDPDLVGYMHAVFSNPGNNTAEQSGIVSRYGIETALYAYLYAARLELHEVSSGRRPNGTDTPSGQSLADFHSWQWQALTEVGNSIGSQPGKPWNMVSKFVNVNTERQKQIERVFPTFDSDSFRHQPNTDSVLRYGGWDMRPSNVMFANGEFDPWRSVTVASEEDSIGAPMRKTVPDIPECGRAPNGTDVFGMIYKGMAHVSDLRKDKRLGKFGTPFDAGLELFSKALEKWLHCFPADAALVSNQLTSSKIHHKKSKEIGAETMVP